VRQSVVATRFSVAVEAAIRLGLVAIIALAGIASFNH
jgi:hypothetical protein